MRTIKDIYLGRMDDISDYKWENSANRLAFIDILIGNNPYRADGGQYDETFICYLANMIPEGQNYYALPFVNIIKNWIEYYGKYTGLSLIKFIDNEEDIHLMAEDLEKRMTSYIQKYANGRDLEVKKWGDAPNHVAAHTVGYRWRQRRF